MINLLPLEDKLAIKKEYRRRLIVIIGISMFGIIGSAIILFIPSYLLLSSLEKSLGTQASALEETTLRTGTEKIESSVADLNESLTLLADSEGRQIYSLLKKILDIRPTTIKISAFYYNKESGKEILSIEGEANTRNSFLSFLSSLEKIKEIKSISSPPSNILKEENISFRLTANLFPFLTQTDQ